MKLRLVMAGVLVAALPAAAETNLFDNGMWSLTGIDGTDPEAHKIAVLVDKQPVGAYADLVLTFNFEGTGPAEVCLLNGDGPIKLRLPPPSVPGGTFHLSSYWECATGLVQEVAITELSFRTKGRAKSPLTATGKLSNFDSLESSKLKLKFYPAETNQVRVDVRYKLKALRDLCVEKPADAEQDAFRIASMGANYLSASSNQNDMVRYRRVTDKACDPYTGCHISRESFCAYLENEIDYLFGTSRRLGDATVSLHHTTRLPYETPTLAVDFRSPRPHFIKPQGFIAPAFDDQVANVLIWGNWVSVKKDYRHGRKVGKFHFVLNVRDPRKPNCDQVKEPPVP